MQCRRGRLETRRIRDTTIPHLTENKTARLESGFLHSDSLKGVRTQHNSLMSTRRTTLVQDAYSVLIGASIRHICNCSLFLIYIPGWTIARPFVLQRVVSIRKQYSDKTLHIGLLHCLSLCIRRVHYTG
jgi:hypothetical protein